MDNTDFIKIYSTLGVFQDDDWGMIRAAYKNQIKRWHPDRFQDPNHRIIAEEKSKEINQAYQKLSEYYEKFGTLPPDHNTETTPVEIYQSCAAVETENFDNSYAHGPTSIQSVQSVTHRNYIPIAVVGIIIALGYSLFMDQPNSPEFIHQTDLQEPNLNGDSDTRLNGDIPIETPDDSDDIPQKNGAILAANTANWGAQENRAIHTARTSSAPESYKAALEIEDTTPANRPVLIKKGSSKKDVLAVQGPPQRQTDTAWDYGTSRIYFQGEHVSGWYENPMNPLNIVR